MSKIKKIREKRNLTQTELANKIGVSQVRISAIEGGSISDIKTYKKIAKALKVDFKELM